VHEWSIVESLLREVDRHARAHGARSVRRLHVRIGELAGVEIPLLESAYASFRERSCCEHAALTVEAVPARWHCARCAHERPRGALLRCDRCGGPLRLASGDEIVLARIEMEVDAHPATSAGRAEETP